MGTEPWWPGVKQPYRLLLLVLCCVVESMHHGHQRLISAFLILLKASNWPAHRSAEFAELDVGAFSPVAEGRLEWMRASSRWFGGRGHKRDGTCLTRRLPILRIQWVLQWLLTHMGAALRPQDVFWQLAQLAVDAVDAGGAEQGRQRRWSPVGGCMASGPQWKPNYSGTDTMKQWKGPGSSHRSSTWDKERFLLATLWRSRDEPTSDVAEFGMLSFRFMLQNLKYGAP
ncbi:hypothetical protein GGX14DRAFT_386856 [Mycena pura]|uniref:Uncharacterized protein n=1 Tax=Mycena pura TaxID=153505 RepID=A0AAD7E2L4_9AGAR|nr:hypothetical protein GGX14DRAFT_386856 [Mycena pura]